jgi:hypothetical protein
MANLSFTVFLSQIKYFKKHPFIISDTVQLICVNQMLILSSTRQHFRICDVLVDISSVGISTSFAATSTSLFVAAMTLFNVDIGNSRSQCHHRKQM